MSAEPVLSVHGITKSFGGLKALMDVSFDIYAGDVFGIIGPNGSGKTTLINCITGFIRTEAGKVTFKGKDITGWQPHKIADIGIARTFQIMRPYHSLPAYKNLIIPLWSPRARKTGGWRGGALAGPLGILPGQSSQHAGRRRQARRRRVGARRLSRWRGRRGGRTARGAFRRLARLGAGRLPPHFGAPPFELAQAEIHVADQLFEALVDLVDLVTGFLDPAGHRTHLGLQCGQAHLQPGDPGLVPGPPMLTSTTTRTSRQRRRRHAAPRHLNVHVWMSRSSRCRRSSRGIRSVCWEYAGMANRKRADAKAGLSRRASVIPRLLVERMTELIMLSPGPGLRTRSVTTVAQRIGSCREFRAKFGRRPYRTLRKGLAPKYVIPVDGTQLPAAPEVRVVTARRFCDQAASSWPRATGRSLP